jgi:hypothetical protein
MERVDTAKCFFMVAHAFAMPDPTEAQLETWHALIGHLDPEVAMAATVGLCSQDREFAPRPGQIIAEAQRMLTPEAPTVAAALGFYMAGDWDVHPIVAKVARACFYDRVMAPDEAKWDFKQRYEAALWDDDQGVRREQRAEIAGQTVLEIGEGR